MVLNFTASRYTLLFLNSETYIVHVINCEWSRSVNFPLRMFCIWCKHVYIVITQHWYQSGLHFELFNMFCAFRIRDNSFKLVDDYRFNFLHGCWNYDLIKTDIDVMMLFKFEFKYVKLIFKVIASIDFSFDIKFCVSCSYGNCLFMKNCWKLFETVLEKLKTRVSRVNFSWSYSRTMILKTKTFRR